MSRSFFNNTSHCSFQGNIINNVAGDYITQAVNPELEGQIVSHGARGESIFDEYQNLRQGDMRLLQQLSIREVDGRPQSWNPQRLEYTTTANEIGLFGHAAGASSHCVAAWERDFLQYSTQCSSYFTFFFVFLLTNYLAKMRYFGSAKVQTLFDTSVTQVYVTATQISRLGEICVAVT
ncbi:hypothetical protein K435DRAFT_802137 [Dendrothele bispora CBS 962.96]|uniref:Uncharacterized protein n=1 Tax=Dendrothele bispora (strain CBS 962.96) TaxID=1314807 RepID=A0A4S8LM16_DENBC|nr:hypothetical protein K435DRAFT_802137 [Dendrothele bispora CBS 962.96]